MFDTEVIGSSPVPIVMILPPVRFTTVAAVGQAAKSLQVHEVDDLSHPGGVHDVVFHNQKCTERSERTAKQNRQAFRDKCSPQRTSILNRNEHRF